MLHLCCAAFFRPRPRGTASALHKPLGFAALLRISSLKRNACHCPETGAADFREDVNAR